ncbi:MAG: hypothetical protein WKF71_06280 [Pyrinomonadaceae bacterium]
MKRHDGTPMTREARAVNAYLVRLRALLLKHNWKRGKPQVLTLTALL